MQNISDMKQDFSVHPMIPDFRLSKEDISKVYGDGWEAKAMALSAMALMIKKRSWSPIIFRNGTRKSSSFLLSTIAALDFDSREYTLKQALRDWCDTVHIIGTTVSHQKEKNGETCDRFRIISVWDYPITKSTAYKPNLKKLMQQNRAQYADKSCTDLARYFLPCRDIVSICTEGYLIETSEQKERVEEFAVDRLEPGELTPFVVCYINSQIPEGERNSKTWQVAKDLFRADYTEPEIVKIVMNSPTYSNVKVEYEQEIRQTIQSAKRNLLEELRGRN